MATFVLVHGGFWGGWSWKKFKPFLEQKNHEVYTPTLTGLGDRQHLNHPQVNLDTHILDIKNFIEFEDLKDVVLVGHSYGGLVITGVAAQIPARIKQLIYLDALIPDNQDSLFTLVEPETKEFFISGAKENGQGWAIPPFPYMADYFEDTDFFQWSSTRFTSQSLASFAQPLTFSESTIKHIPKVFIYCTKSYPIMNAMRLKAQKKGWPTFAIESNHFPMIDHPQQLSDLLIKAAQ